MLSTDDLCLMAAIARSSTLTGAARLCGCNLPTLSRRLQALEASLGVQLAVRTTRSLSLTPEGKRLIEGSRDILARIEALEDSVRAVRRGVAGSLRINCSYGFGQKIVGPALGSFVDRSPDVRVTLKLSDHPLLLADCGCNLGLTIGHVPNAGYRARRLFVNNKVLVAAPGYLKRCRIKPQSVSDLGRLRTIDVVEDYSTSGLWTLTDGSSVKSARIHPDFSTNSSTVATAWALAGEGVMLRSVWAIADDLRAGRLIRILPEWHQVSDGWAYYAENQKSDLLEAFLAHLARHIEQEGLLQVSGSPAEQPLPALD